MRLNPVLTRELSGRMRGPRAAFALTLHLFVLSAVFVGAYQWVTSRAETSGEPLALRLGALGRSSFGWLVLALSVALAIVLPITTAASVAAERERQTLVPMQLTLLTPWRILLGKIGASLCFVLFLMVAAAPLLAVPVLIGGVDKGQVLRAVVAIVAQATVLTALGVLISALCRRTQTALVISLTASVAALFGSFVVWTAVQSFAFDETSKRHVADVALLANPVVGVADFVTGRHEGKVGADRPVEFIARSVGYTIVKPDDSPPTTAVGAPNFVNPVFGQQVAAPAPKAAPFYGDRKGGESGRWGLPFWAWSLVAYAAMLVGLFALSVRRLRLPARSDR